MAAAWRALATKLCIRVPARRRDVIEDNDAPTERESISPPPRSSAPDSEAEKVDAVPDESLESPSESMRLSSSGSRSSKKLCAICLGGMSTGHGQALFTAECSHRFHFHCISSNVRHGNLICPVCRAEWKELPFQGTQPALDSTHGRSRISSSNWPQDDGRMAVIHRLSSHDYSGNLLDAIAVLRDLETDIFNDDEHIDLQSETVDGHDAVQIKTYPEFQAVKQSVSQKVFAILIHLKAPPAMESASSRAPIDLVTVLDVSGSMKGKKLALLKRAMSFVIQTLGPSDRLSVIAFSSAARRLFPLCRMTPVGQQEALQAVNSLVDGGGTNIADGLKKGARVIEGRRLKNPVCSIILLSDGQDTYTLPGSSVAVQSNHTLLVPPSILPGAGHHVQIHTFGFGADHDSAAMHTIAETTSGTFSFVDAEGSIQDGFSQCIGGLLSVVSKEMQLSINCVDQGVNLSSIKSGSYASQVAVDERSGTIKIGDLYADEERAFLITVSVPAVDDDQQNTVLIKPSCTYEDTITAEKISIQSEQEVTIQRPAHCVDDEALSPEVEREWHRVRAMEDMAAARDAAEEDAFDRAASILEDRRRILEAHCAADEYPDDSQCLALITELKGMQGRVENRQMYEESGRALMLSGISSHSWQRATARGDSTELTTGIHTYQTPSMAGMLQLSQTLEIAHSQSSRDG